MKKTSIVIVLALVLVLVTATTGFAGKDVRCNNGRTIQNRTVDNVEVKRGVCNLLNVEVKGNVKVEEGWALYTFGSSVEGDIQSDGAVWMTIYLGSVDGNVQLKKTQKDGWNWVLGVSVGGDVQIEESEARSYMAGLAGGSSTVGGNVQAFKNEWENDNGWPSVTSRDYTIYGDLQCKENDPAAAQLNNTVHGNLECPE